LDTDRYAEAEPLLKRALYIGERTLGEEHPAVATMLDNLALLYGATKRLAEAKLAYERVIAIREKVLPSDHP
jgi:tetratricopeptide (TPR) repeat protein